MDIISETKKNLLRAQDIWIFPSKNLPDAIPSSLALFYTLKKISKNVNLFLESFPKKIDFLIPSLNNIYYPSEFTVLIKNSGKDVSQISYEKNGNDLKLHFSLKKGAVKKENVSFEWNFKKPDLIVAIGIKKLNEIETLYNKDEVKNSPILNIDSQTSNEKFGKINLIEQNSTVTEITAQIIKSIDENLFEENISTCLLTGLILVSENFSKPKNLSQNFERANFLIKKGGAWQKVIDFIKNYEAEPK